MNPNILYVKAVIEITQSTIQTAFKEMKRERQHPVAG